jgi:Uncharacterized protein conserved in bacteria (DUF2252)
VVTDCAYCGQPRHFVPRRPGWARAASWEWDVKRLAASFEIAGRNLAFSPADRRAIVMAGVREYRERSRDAVGMRTLDSWYAHMSVNSSKPRYWSVSSARAGTAIMGSVSWPDSTYMRAASGNSSAGSA